MKAKHSFSITKFGESVNEDAVLVRPNVIAVSDGAGGGGVFADEWSRYLLDNLPTSPFSGYEEFDGWVNGISDKFYDTHEEIARQKGGIFLDKFYDEGAFATLVAVWRVAVNEYVWISYGDSVAFAYNPADSSLEHSFTHLVDFNRPPHLISLISPLNREGYRSGRFVVPPGSFVFVASDAIAHYILARYYSAIGLQPELSDAIDAKSRNSSYVKANLKCVKKDFYEDVIHKLFRTSLNKANTTRMLQKLYRDGQMGLDDYSLAFMPGELMSS